MRHIIIILFLFSAKIYSNCNDLFNFNNLNYEIRSISKSLFTGTQIFHIPPEIKMNSDLIIAFDKNYHSFLLTKHLEFHGKVLVKPTSLRTRNKDTMKALFFVRIHLGEWEINQIENFIRSTMSNVHTLSCINSILYILHNALNIQMVRSEGENLFWMRPTFESLLSEGLSTKKNKKFKLDLYLPENLKLSTILIGMSKLDQFFYNFRFVARSILKMDFSNLVFLGETQLLDHFEVAP